MRIRKKTLRKLGSFTALSAGALALTTAEAEASVVTGDFNVVQNADTPWPGAEVRLSLPWSNVIKFQALRYRLSIGTYWAAYADGMHFGTVMSGSVKFRASNGRLLNVFSTGQRWTAAIGSHSWPILGMRTCTYKRENCRIVAGNDIPHSFALFHFREGTSNAYGWVELSMTMTATTGPVVTLGRWAYDDSGNMLAAGDTGAVPEPSSPVLSGLGTLALGAAGLRRWRSARRG